MEDNIIQDLWDSRFPLQSSFRKMVEEVIEEKSMLLEHVSYFKKDGHILYKINYKTKTIYLKTELYFFYKPIQLKLVQIYINKNIKFISNQDYK